MKKAMALACCLSLFALAGSAVLTADSVLAAGKHEEHVTCPTCQLQAVRIPRPKGGARTYFKHVCPTCGTTHSAESTGEKIHVCEKCGVELNQCPTCASKG